MHFALLSFVLDSKTFGHYLQSNKKRFCPCFVSLRWLSRAAPILLVQATNFNLTHPYIKSTTVRMLSDTHFLFAEVSGYPQNLTIVSTEQSNGNITFAWEEPQCDKLNGILLGYECIVYFDTFNIKENVLASATYYTLSVFSFSQSTLPRAFSVAAITSFGVGDHCPPLNLSLTEFG